MTPEPKVVVVREKGMSDWAVIVVIFIVVAGIIAGAFSPPSARELGKLCKDGVYSVSLTGKEIVCMEARK